MKDVVLYILVLALCGATSVATIKCVRQDRILTCRNAKIEKLVQQCQSVSNELAKARSAISALEAQRGSDKVQSEQLHAQIAERDTQIAARDSTIERAKEYVAMLKAQAATRTTSVSGAAAATATPQTPAVTRPAATGSTQTTQQRSAPQLSGSSGITGPSQQGKLADGYVRITDENGQETLERRKLHATGHKRDVDGNRIIRRLGE